MSGYKFEPLNNREGFASMLEGVAASIREGSLSEVVMITGNGERDQFGELSVFMPDTSQFDALKIMNDGQAALLDLFMVTNEQEDEDEDD